MQPAGDVPWSRPRGLGDTWHRGLFDRAVDSYLVDVVDPLLGPLEIPGSGPEQIAGFDVMASVPRDPDQRVSKRGADELAARAEVLTAAHVGIMTTARIAPQAAALASETIAADIRGGPQPGLSRHSRGESP